MSIFSLAKRVNFVILPIHKIYSPQGMRAADVRQSQDDDSMEFFGRTVDRSDSFVTSILGSNEP